MADERVFRFLLATENQGKIREFKRIIRELSPDHSWQILSSKDVGIGAAEETGSTFMENAEEKAVFASLRTEYICVGEDSGLETDALSGGPGIHSHRFSESGKDEDNNDLLLAKLENVPDSLRTARYKSAIAVSFKGEVLLKAEGSLEGLIAKKPSGDGGFGYDPIFFSPELGKTLGTASAHEKDEISHRRRAIEKLFPQFPMIFMGMQNGE